MLFEVSLFYVNIGTFMVPLILSRITNIVMTKTYLSNNLFITYQELLEKKMMEEKDNQGNPLVDVEGSAIRLKNATKFYQIFQDKKRSGLTGS
jgi:signal transduction histidine kinase